MYEHVIHTEPAVLDSVQTSDLVTTSNTEVASFTNFAHYGLSLVSANVLQFLLSVGIVATIDGVAAALLFASGAMTLLVTRTTGRWVRGRYQTARREYGGYVSWLFEVINGRREIRRLGAQATVIGWFLRRQSVLIRQLISAWWADLTSRRAVEFDSDARHHRHLLVGGAPGADDNHDAGLVLGAGGILRPRAGRDFAARVAEHLGADRPSADEPPP